MGNQVGFRDSREGLDTTLLFAHDAHMHEKNPKRGLNPP
jgi:hypothetical protein